MRRRLDKGSLSFSLSLSLSLSYYRCCALISDHSFRSWMLLSTALLYLLGPAINYSRSLPAPLSRLLPVRSLFLVWQADCAFGQKVEQEREAGERRKREERRARKVWQGE